MTTYIVRIDLPGLEAETPQEAAMDAVNNLRAKSANVWAVEVAEDTDQDLAGGLEDSVMVEVRVSKEGNVSAALQGEEET
jgi:hypothetical protein